MYFFFFKQKTAYEMRISDWSSDVCSSDLIVTRCAILECRRLQAEPLLGDGTVRRLRKQRRPCRLSSDAPPTSAPQCRSHRRVPPSIPINPALPPCPQPASKRCRPPRKRTAPATRASVCASPARFPPLFPASQT